MTDSKSRWRQKKLRGTRRVRGWQRERVTAVILKVGCWEFEKTYSTS